MDFVLLLELLAKSKLNSPVISWDGGNSMVVEVADVDAPWSF